ncbi:hypothetical protein, partial [Salinisphaera sp.]|uniref:hypothetical protein n=1 Tax=Salinisphaera sp. TaxID=1914330 RepID=UPI002D768ED3
LATDTSQISSSDIFSINRSWNALLALSARSHPAFYIGGVADDHIVHNIYYVKLIKAVPAETFLFCKLDRLGTSFLFCPSEY